jgi:hypothetical protein
MSCNISWQRFAESRRLYGSKLERAAQLVDDKKSPGESVSAA